MRSKDWHSWSLEGIAVLAWAVLRIPLLLLLLYWSRDSILSWIEQRFDIVFVTVFAIDLLSTPLTRVLYASALAVALLTCLAVLRFRLPRFAVLMTLCFAAALIMSSLYLTGTQRRLAALPLLILATNLAYYDIVDKHTWHARVYNLFMLFGVGVAELFSIRRYLEWVARRLGRGGLIRRMASAGIWLDAPALVLASAVAATLLSRYPLVPIEQAMRMSDAAKIVARGDFNWIALDRTSQYLYVTGPGVPHVRRYRLGYWSLPPLESDAETGGAQTFSYDPATQKIYTFNLKTRHLLFLDAGTLELKHMVPLPEMSPGDPWIITDDRSDTIAVASEADASTGVPFVLLDRATGATLDTQDLDPGNLLLHPHQSLLYMSFFRRETRILAYDLNRREVIRYAHSDPRAERMAFWEDGNELLVASPMESRVLRYDADTLAPRGSIKSVFGVRALAIDDARGLLLCGSLATGIVAVVDLRDGRLVARYYLGPWIRTIVVRPDEAVAYVSSRGALYTLRYTAGTGL